MGYPKNIKASFEVENNYGVKKSERATQENVAFDFAKETFLNHGPTLQFPFQFSVATSDPRVLAVEIAFTEGMAVPDGATAEFTKTLPLGVDTSDIQALFTPITYSGPCANAAAVREALRGTLPVTTLNDGAILIFEDYKKLRVTAGTRPGLGMAALNLEYADKIALTPGSYLLGAYNDRVGIFYDGLTNLAKSALLSVYLNKANNSLVFNFKKTGATSSISFNTGQWAAFVVIK